MGDLYALLPFKFKMLRPSHISSSNVSRSILSPCSIHGMRGSRKTSCDGLANKKYFYFLSIFLHGSNYKL